jgi:hypothetical protein
LTDHAAAAIRTAIGTLFTAAGTLLEQLDTTPPGPDAITLRNGADAITDAADWLQDLFCRADPQGYRQWAVDWSKEFDFVLEPCDAWFEGDYGPWIDGSNA